MTESGSEVAMIRSELAWVVETDLTAVFELDDGAFVAALGFLRLSNLEHSTHPQMTDQRQAVVKLDEEVLSAALEVGDGSANQQLFEAVCRPTDGRLPADDYGLDS